MGKFVDLTGKSFHRLSVIGIASKGNKIKWACKCICGNEVFADSYQIKSGAVKSCGCLRNERVKHMRLSHGMSNSSEYNSWRSMRERCDNPNYHAYLHYGGRGIKYCDRWKSFSNFLEDMGRKPSKDFTLDRINVDGDYTPDNCRWTTESIQKINTNVRKDNKSGYKGVYWAEGEKRWKAFVSVNGTKKNLGTYKEKQDAINARIAGEKLYY